MTYHVQLSAHAVREYRKLDASARGIVEAGIEALRRSPVAGAKIKRMKGRLHEYHRYRAGDYRIVYVVEQKERKVYVDYIQHRKDVYREID